MIRRLAALYARYEAAHLRLDRRGQPVLDANGGHVGHLDAVTVAAGRLRVRGWVQAAHVRLVLGGVDAGAAPILRRPDVATALGLPETVGFDLSVPAKIADLRHADPPGLVITADAGKPAISALSLPLPLPGRARLRTMATFVRDACLALPAILGWKMTGQPRYRSIVKARLRLDDSLGNGPLEPRLFRDADTVEPRFTPQTVTIVLPVYNAFDLLPDVLDRVVRHTDLPWRMIAIEDCSTDDRVRPWLRDWAAGLDQVELMENDKNLGFIASVNRGLARALSYDGPDEGPVILLNSDAFVPQDWARRLIWPFQNHDKVATVTPMSNDAEIFSAPVICTRTVLAPGQGDAIDRVAQSFAPEALLSVAPTGVGFCMAMGRDWLARLPELDTAFGRGYGEEVDWCQKAARLGGRHLGLPGLFVEHRGGESFGSAEKRALVAKNNEIVARRYPGYDQSVQEFIAEDPLRSARLALGLAWAGSLDPKRAVPVYLAHAMGGGADHWLEHHMTQALEAGQPSVVLRVGGARRWQIELVAPGGRSFGQSDDAKVITRLLALLPRRHVVYSCGVGDPDPAGLPDMLLGLLQDDDSAEMLFHDYFPLSPAYTLLDSDGVYRGPVVPPRADAVHHTRRLDGTALPLEGWQSAWHAFAARADLTVFSDDSARQVAAVWPDLAARITNRPHTLRSDVPRLRPAAAEAPTVIGVLGNIGLQKGAGVVQQIAQKLERSGSARIVLVGNIDPAFALPGSAPVHGNYRVSDLGNLGRKYGLTHWLIPSIWPETFCYTVHEALATGLPVYAFGIGAQGDAVRAAPNGHVLPFDAEADLAQTVLTALGLDHPTARDTTTTGTT